MWRLEPLSPYPPSDELSGTRNGRSWKICCCFRFISEFLRFFIIFSFVPLIKRDKSIAIVQVNKGKMFDNQLVEFSTKGMDDPHCDWCMRGLLLKRMETVLRRNWILFVCLRTEGCADEGGGRRGGGAGRVHVRCITWTALIPGKLEEIC